VLLHTGEVMCWGANYNGEVGVKNAGDHVYEPMKVAGLSIGVVAISAGTTHTCALMRTSEVMCWGRWMDHGLDTDEQDDHPTPVVINNLDGPVAAVSAGNELTCALMTNGGVKCWGHKVHDPIDVTGLGRDVAAVSSGSSHLCALMTDGVIKCWGYNSYGQLGNGSTEYPDSPVEVICPGCEPAVPGVTATPTSKPM
jgi:alpha-tubulin suppressor-like RCC1 family protein